MAREVAMSLQFALLGISGVGKTCLFKQYFGELDPFPKSTINPSSKKKYIVVKHLGRDIRVQLCVWDTAGMEQFQALMPQYYRATHGFIVVYDITCRESFEALDRIFIDAETFATIEDHAKIVVGNKIDKEKDRKVSRAEGLKYAHSKDCAFIETSAITNEAVDHIFEKLATRVLSNSNLWKHSGQENVRVHQTTQPVQESSGCGC